MKNIAILGSTGSIGRQVLEVIEFLGTGYRVIALAAGSNDVLVARQVERFRPELVALNDEEAAGRLARIVPAGIVRVLAGREGQLEAATLSSADLVVMAQVGFSGFEPLVAALKKGKKVALANKESVVVGGELLARMGLLDRNNILPVDSEHAAIRQCLGSARHGEVARIYLTASGGPFFGRDREYLNRVTPEEALKHPNWKMGAKITIDSATMMNKGLEVIEACRLFDLELDRIEVVIHRQSIVHSMVEFVDGSILAQLAVPDMRLPILQALTTPERKAGPVGRFDPFGRKLEFARPDRVNFPCLDLAYRAAIRGGTMPAVLNGANEVAVQGFLKNRIFFTAIAEIIAGVMEEHAVVCAPGVAELVDADSWARKKALELIDTFMEG